MRRHLLVVSGVVLALSHANAQNMRVVDLRALKTLNAQSNNSNESGWLTAGVRESEARLKQ